MKEYSKQQQIGKNRKKEKKGIAPYSRKRKEIQEQYNRTKEQQNEDPIYCCQACLKNSNYIRPCHRIPRSVKPKLISVAENIDWLCDECDYLIQLGRWMELKGNVAEKLALDIDKYILENAPEYYNFKKKDL